MGKNPLVGPHRPELGQRFPDMTHTYNPHLQKILEASALRLKIPLKKGVYCSLLGPTYETPAEIRMLKKMGADMVGMSTVPEAIAAHHMGVKVAAISCITNFAAGLDNTPLRHEDIKQVARKALHNFSHLICSFIEALAEGTH